MSGSRGFLTKETDQQRSGVLTLRTIGLGATGTVEPPLDSHSPRSRCLNVFNDSDETATRGSRTT